MTQRIQRSLRKFESKLNNMAINGRREIQSNAHKDLRLVMASTKEYKDLSEGSNQN
jgi:hypothetical protein